MIKALLAAIIVGTWNGNWFPSGRAEHRAHPEVEAATIKAVGAMLRGGIDAMDPAGTNDVVLCLCEIRNKEAAQALCSAIGRTNLKVAVVSGYRRRDRFDQQQNVIMTTLPVAEASWSVWKSSRGVRPPRGYAMAKLVVAPAVTSVVYSVHLKANYGATTEEIRAANRKKRNLSAKQMVEMTAKHENPVIIAGDFNTDKWRNEFAEDKIFSLLEGAGYMNAMALLQEGSRGTHVNRNRRLGDSTLDYIYVRGFGSVGSPRIFPADDLSDHKPVFAIITP